MFLKVISAVFHQGSENIWENVLGIWSKNRWGLFANAPRFSSQSSKVLLAHEIYFVGPATSSKPSILVFKPVKIKKDDRNQLVNFHNMSVFVSPKFPGQVLPYACGNGLQ